MKKLAILIYPNFSIQEIGDIMYIFRWFYNIETDIISSSKDVIVSEEGVSVLPDKTVREFDKNDYHCLILPGCSDFKESIQDEVLINFLKTFQNDREFIIGAIGSGPIFLAYAGIMKGKKFINSLFHQLNQQCSFIEFENLRCQPVVVDGNIITAVGSEKRKFAIEVSRQLGFECSDQALSELNDDYTDEDFIHYLPDEQFEEVKAHLDFLFK